LFAGVLLVGPRPVTTSLESDGPGALVALPAPVGKHSRPGNVEAGLGPAQPCARTDGAGRPGSAAVGMSGVGLEDEGEPVASAQSVQGLLDRADDVLVGRVASGHLVDGSSGEQIKLRHSGNFGLQPRETLWGTEVNPFGADGNGELPGPIAVARLEAERSQGPGGLQATVLEVDQQDPQRPGKRGECKGMQGSGEGYADLPDESGFSGPLFPC
jgi:hypothetical protein